MAKGRKEILEVEGYEVTLSNPDKLYFAKAGITKRQLVDYYLAVKPGVMRAVARRQVVAQRDLELGEVAAERLEVAALDIDVVVRLEDERAKAVPLRLVDPPISVGNLVRQLRQHGLHGRLKWEL
jgi:hypothetical protein